MIFVTEKEDELSESVIRDFPCVKVVKITDEEAIQIFAQTQKMYVDSRIDENKYSGSFCILRIMGYIKLTPTKSGYVTELVGT